jgi:LPS-assembly protein
MKKIFLLLLFTTTCVANTTNLTNFDDWVVCNSCGQDADKLCQGYYKPLPLPDVTSQTQKQPIKVTADAANFVAKGTSVFTGNVVASQGDKIIYADKATVVHNAVTGELETITAYGHVKIMQPGIRVDGSKVVAYVTIDKQSIDNAVYRLYDRHARGEASNVVVNNKNNMQLSQCTYTTCAPDSNAWYLKSTSTEFDKASGRGSAWHAKMYVKDLPIFYWPYVNFPIDKRRQTGFLTPEFENSSLDGKTVTLPYYLNLAPNYDATITPNYMSLRGFKFDSIFRYLTKTSSGAFNADFLPQDRAYRSLRETSYASPEFMQSTDTGTVLRRNDLGNSNFRYRLAWKNTSYFTPNWLFSVNYTDASDGNYLYDFRPNSSSYITDKDSTIYALQNVALQYFSMFGTVKAQVERYKTFHVINGPSGTEQLTKLPALYFNSNTYHSPQGFEALINANYINFRPNVIPQDNTSLSYGQRFYARPSLSYPIINPGWFVNPRVQLNYVQYDKLTISNTDLANGVSPYSTSLAIPMYDIKTGLIFDRCTKIRNTELLQTLEPTLYYLYVPAKNQNNLPNLDSGLLTFDYNQVFRDNRYTGYDFVNDVNQLSIGIASKFFNANTGEELGMLGIGRIKYFRNQLLPIDQELDNTEQNWSPYAMVAKLRLSSDYDLEANVVTSESVTETASLQLQYHPTRVRVINFSYQYVKDAEPDDLTGLLNSNLSQVSMSTAWQVSAPWRVLGKINYDLRFHRYLETIAGVEYHTCCTALRALWGRTWMPELYSQHGHNNVFRLQFIFKGFAGIGNADARYIASVIPGYVSE